MIERDDLLGPKYIDRESFSALVELDNMRGLENVKKAIQQLLQLVKTNVELEEKERPIREVTLNRIFSWKSGYWQNDSCKTLWTDLEIVGNVIKGRRDSQKSSRLCRSSFGGE